MGTVPAAVAYRRTVVAGIGGGHPVTVVECTRHAAIGGTTRAAGLADEVVALQQGAGGEIRVLGQDAGIEHGHHDALALRDVPCGRCVHATDRVVEVPVVALVVRIVGHEAGRRIGLRDGVRTRRRRGIDRIHDGVGHRIFDGRVSLQFAQHLVQFGARDPSLQADQIGTDAQLAGHLRAQRGTARSRVGTCRHGAGDGRVDHGQLGVRIGSCGAASAVLHDDAINLLRLRAGQRRICFQVGGLCQANTGQRQHGGCQHIDAKVLLLDHVEFLFWVMDRTNTAAIIP